MAHTPRCSHGVVALARRRQAEADEVSQYPPRRFLRATRHKAQGVGCERRRFSWKQFCSELTRLRQIQSEMGLHLKTEADIIQRDVFMIIRLSFL